jgi:hypothetical protein
MASFSGFDSIQKLILELAKSEYLVHKLLAVGFQIFALFRY